MKAGDELAVIESKEFPLLFASRQETYLTPEISERIDKVIREHRAGKLLARPLAAGEIDL